MSVMGGFYRRQNAGFTLIEIVLVLAIAALLLVLVFLAVSGVQRARRDQQRKQDVAAFVAAGVRYASDHNFDTPEDYPDYYDFLDHYFTPRKDPTTGVQYVGDYEWRGADHNLPGPAIGHILFVQGHICNTVAGSADLIADPPFLGITSRNFAGLVRLESGGVYCVTGDY